jgi:Domain of unknown function (DUF1788)
MGRRLVQDTLHNRFEHLFRVISDEGFVKMQGLGKDVPFFICPYEASETCEMEQNWSRLINRLGSFGVSVFNANLYDISISILKNRGIWDQILDSEAQYPKDEIKELLQGVLDPENHLVPEISRQMEQHKCDVLFITGVGEVYPYLRSHNVLNNLQSKVKDRPTVMFFPGQYSHTKQLGSSLDLFGRLSDDKYYRAFDIFDYMPNERVDL